MRTRSVGNDSLRHEQHSNDLLCHASAAEVDVEPRAPAEGLLPMGKADALCSDHSGVEPEQVRERFTGRQHGVESRHHNDRCHARPANGQGSDEAVVGFRDGAAIAVDEVIDSQDQRKP